MTGDDPFDLARFLIVQEPVFARVLDELERGRKETHWIWFIFPQIRGLGRSATAAHFGIASRSEAVAYIAHDVLGPRLVTCTTLMLNHASTAIEIMLPYPDHLKFHSSMTLFASVAPEQPVFATALDVFFGCRHDAVTLRLLAELG